MARRLITDERIFKMQGRPFGAVRMGDDWLYFHAEQKPAFLVLGVVFVHGIDEWDDPPGPVVVDDDESEEIPWGGEFADAIRDDRVALFVQDIQRMASEDTVEDDARFIGSFSSWDDFELAD